MMMSRVGSIIETKPVRWPITNNEVKVNDLVNGLTKNKIKFGNT